MKPTFKQHFRSGHIPHWTVREFASAKQESWSLPTPIISPQRAVIQMKTVQTPDETVVFSRPHFVGRGEVWRPIFQYCGFPIRLIGINCW